MRSIFVLLAAVSLLAAPVQAQVGGALYQQACDDGDMESCDVLGQMYERGSGEPQDAAHAAILYRRACDGATMSACTHLAVLYANGSGVAQDIPQSVTLFQEACDGGDETGCEQLDYLMGVMQVALFSELPVEGRMLTMGAESQGELGPADLKGPGGSFVQAWTIQLSAGQPASVDLLSESFDAYLWVTGPGLDTALGDDDDAGACDARVSFTAPQGGQYRVVASTAQQGAAGPYTLRVSETAGAVKSGACTQNVAPISRGGRGGGGGGGDRGGGGGRGRPRN